MRCRNFFSAAIRQGSEACLPFSDNNFWICLLLSPSALSHLRPVFPFPSSLPPSFLSVGLFCLLLFPCLPQRFVQPTVEAMAFVFQAPVAVTTAGWAPGVTRGRVTRAAMSMAHAGMANVNAVLVGMENTALLVGRDKAVVWVVMVVGERRGGGLLQCICLCLVRWGGWGY